MVKNRLEGSLGRGIVQRNRSAASLFRALILSALISLFSVSSVPAMSSNNVPLDDWTYGALDKLEGSGLIRSEIKGTRPFTRLEVARLVCEASTIKEQESKELPELLNHLFDRLKKEYKQELGVYGCGSETPARTSLKPLDEVQARYVYSEGEPRQFRGPPPTYRGIRATEGTPLVYNNEGVIYGEGSNLTLQFSSSFRLWDVFSGYLEPIVLLRQDEGDMHDFDTGEIDLLKGYVKLSPWNIELEAGRDSMWWGQGYHGTLLLTNNASPLDLLKLSNPNPTLLPWYFKYLGPIKYTLFCARLEDDRPHPNPYLAGARLQMKPLPYFEFGAATTFIFNGEGVPSLSFEDFLSMFGFQGSVSPRNADQLAALDARLTLPFLWNIQVYGEYGGEDSGSSRPEELIFRDLAYIVGFYVPKIDPSGRADFRFEYANNAYGKGPGHRGFWYGHSTYWYGYTFDQMILGHPMGPDAEDYFARTTYYLRDDLQLGLDYDLMRRGINNPRWPAVETVNAVGTDATYDIKDNMSIGARYAFENVDNFDMNEGDTRQGHLVMTTFKWSF